MKIRYCAYCGKPSSKSMCDDCQAELAGREAFESRCDCCGNPADGRYRGLPMCLECMLHQDGFRIKPMPHAGEEKEENEWQT